MRPLNFFTAAFLFAASLNSHAQDSGSEVSLFDGQSLEQWTYDPAVWRVEDGLITGGSTTENIKQNFYIATKKSYQNFELKFSIKCSGEPKTGLINSGIQLRSLRFPGGADMAGYQVDCGDTWFGKIWDESRRNRMMTTPVDPEALAKVVDVFGWNHYRILAEGLRIRVWINEVLATDFTETNPKVALDGHIAAQVHKGGVTLVQVKDVSIVELPATADAPTWQSLGGLEKALEQAPPAKKKRRKVKLPKSSTGPILDLDADKGVTLEDGDRVSIWRNQVADAKVQDFVKRDEGRKEAGSGRPTLKKNVAALNGHSSLEFLQQELVHMDEDAFDHLTQGSGNTWITVLSVQAQRIGLKDVNSFFGNLENGERYSGFWGALNDDNTLWWGARNGLTFGRFDKNNPQLLGPKLKVGKFYLIAGRMGAGQGVVPLEFFVNSAVPVSASTLKVIPTANPSKMAIGQERDAIEHPGKESFDGEIARLLMPSLSRK